MVLICLYRIFEVLSSFFFSTSLFHSIIVKLKSLFLTHSRSKNRLNSYNNFTIGRRNFSTFKVNYSNKKSSRKTLKSPEAKPYEDLYLGRGKPEFESYASLSKR